MIRTSASTARGWFQRLLKNRATVGPQLERAGRMMVFAGQWLQEGGRRSGGTTEGRRVRVQRRKAKKSN